jgi:catechol 2,3-dioxygenase-like lactoylglutathione lyase family enzyme
VLWPITTANFEPFQHASGPKDKSIMPTDPRPIDHAIIAVHDLEAARATFARLGFTLTPVARHPFGTANSLVQLGGSYIELLAVVDPARIPEPDAGAFSFAAFNRNYLAHREGFSMLAFQSADAGADRANFAAHGLPDYPPMTFHRLARDPRGNDLEVGFSSAFTSDARIRDAGFFTCQHHNPDRFWWPEYQAHANGAARIDAAVMASRDPADYHIFFTYLTGQHDMRSDSLMVSYDLGPNRLELLTPVAAKAMVGVEVAKDARPRFVALRIAVADLATAAVTLRGNGVPFSERMGRLVVPPEAACGVALAFVAA